MSFLDFIFGSDPETTIIPQQPLLGPGYEWAQNFFNQYLPQYMSQSLPSYPGQLDPGLSPTMQAMIRQGQQYSMGGYPDIMGQSSAVLGRYMNQPYQPYQYQSGPEQQSLQGFMNPNLISPSMLGAQGGSNFGFGQGIDVSQGQRLLPPGAMQAQNPMGLRNTSAGFNQGVPSSPPLGVDDWPSDESPRPTGPPPEGGGGSIPPGFELPWVPGTPRRPGPNLHGISPAPYSPIGVNPSFVNWDPFNPRPSMGPGGAAAFSNTSRSPGAGPAPGGGPTPTPRDPNAIVPQGNLEWFGRWRGPNAGKTREEAVADMWRRGWDMGQDYAPNQSIIDQWTAAGEPTEFGSRPTYGREINQRLGLGLGGNRQPSPGVLPQGGGLRVGGGAGSTFDPRQRQPASPGGGLGDMISQVLTPRQPQADIEMMPTGGNRFAPAPRFPTPPQGGMPPGLQPQPQPQPRPQPQPQPQGSQGTSYLDAWQSTIPVVQEQLRGNISDAMATAGFSGNRFSSGAQREAARAGATAGQQLGSNLMSLLYGQTEADKNRALQATGMGLQDRQFQNQLGFTGRENYFDRILQGADVGARAGTAQNQIDQSRLQLPFDMARYEQDRQDRYPLLAMNDFNQGRLGYLPYFAQLAGAQGSGQNVSPIQTTGSAGPGLVDLAGAVLPWVLAFSDEDLKRDIETIPADKAWQVVNGAPARMWRWIENGQMDAGVVAQELERVAPELVHKDEMTGRKKVSVTGIIGHILAAVQDLGRRLDQLEGAQQWLISV